MELYLLLLNMHTFNKMGRKHSEKQRKIEEQRKRDNKRAENLEEQAISWLEETFTVLTGDIRRSSGDVTAGNFRRLLSKDFLCA